MLPNVSNPPPPPYLVDLVNYLKAEEAPLWDWFANDSLRPPNQNANAAAAEQHVRLDLLKRTYRVDPESQPELYGLVSKVAHTLNVDAPITIYQAQNPVGLNASLAFIPGEVHLVLHGPIADKLSTAEQRALFGHEFGHFLLFETEQGVFRIADRVLAALSHDRNADLCHLATARLFHLYSEVYCDLTALSVTKDPAAVIAMLVKVLTGLDEIDVSSYQQQAAEIIATGKTESEGITHPEAYLRAHITQLLHEEGAQAYEKVARLIEGKPHLDELDLLARQDLFHKTRGLIEQIMAPGWMQSDLLIAHAKLFFEDYQPGAVAEKGLPKPTASQQRSAADETADRVAERPVPYGVNQANSDTNPKLWPQNQHGSVHDLVSFTLLDFAASDRELEPAALAHTLLISDRLGIGPRFRELARKELRLTKKALATIDQQKDELIRDASNAGAIDGI